MYTSRMLFYMDILRDLLSSLRPSPSILVSRRVPVATILYIFQLISPMISPRLHVCAQANKEPGISSQLSAYYSNTIIHYVLQIIMCNLCRG